MLLREQQAILVGHLKEISISIKQRKRKQTKKTKKQKNKK
jgi:hypothetical protein